jgi:hypothetical protein
MRLGHKRYAVVRQRSEQHPDMAHMSHARCGKTIRMHGVSKGLPLLTLLFVALLLSGCGLGPPTRTPFPTFTPTPLGAGEPNVSGQPVTQQPAAPVVPVVQPTPFPTLPPTIPPTATPTPEPTATPTDTPTPQPTATETPTPLPTDTPTPSPSPTPSFTFELEAAEKFPTESLAPNIVRIYIYAYSETQFGLPGYTITVTHNGARLPVDQVTRAGIPDQTRPDPSPYTRFTNMNVIFVEAQEGEWVVQLVDRNGIPAGPAATFELSATEDTRELYVRYRSLPAGS